MSELVQWLVYESPSDYPGKWVVRKFVVTDSSIEPGAAYVCESLETAREHIPFGFCNIGRMPGDEPQIKEVWI